MRFPSHPTSPARIGLTPIATSVIWLVFAVSGVAGLRLQYQQAQARAKDPPPVVAEQMDVRMIGSAAPVPTAQAATPSPPAMPDSPPQAPALPAVAAPSPEIPFAMPVNAPVRRSVAVTAAPQVEHLTFGTGEGDKPAPEYPREAKIAHQQGTVVVRFQVDENGHVTDAWVESASAYPLLNQAAVRAVRDTWDHFPTGKARLYNVSFQFELR